MIHKNTFVFIFLLPLFLCISCLYSRTTAQTFTVNNSITVNSGSAILKIDGKVNENLYNNDPYSDPNRNQDYYDNPAIREGTITKNETKILYAGENYVFSVLPTEVVTVNIKSVDDNDVEISVFKSGNEQKYIINGKNQLGYFISFQNR